LVSYFSGKSLKLLPPDALILAQNTPKCVWRPGSTRTRWESLSAPPDPLAAKGGLLLRGGEAGDGREGEGREKGKGGILPDQSKDGCYGPAVSRDRRLQTVSYRLAIEASWTCLG